MRRIIGVGIVVTLAVIAELCVGVLFSAWVTETLWEWYLAGAGHPRISYPVAVGLVLVVRSVLPPGNAYKSDEVDGWKSMARQVTVPLGVLMVGWILLHFL